MPNSMDPRTTSEEQRRSKGVRRTQYVIGLSYGYDAAMLFGFYCAGYIDIRLPLIFAALCGICVGSVFLAHASSWSRKQADPTLFLPQQLFAISIALAVAVLAPQIAFQPFATLFAICAFGFMAPSTSSFIISWSAGAAGALAIIVLLGPRLEMPTSTLMGQIITGGVVLGLLARCIWIALFVKRLQLRLKERNSALKEAMARIEALANLDELTGLPNRRAIIAFLDEQIMICMRTSLSLTVALVDVDHFKRINDRCGHQAGDRTLQIFARVAASCLRKTDRIGRFGGEEFLVVLVGTPLKAAEEPLDRIRDKLKFYDWRGVGEDIEITVTIGAAAYMPGEPVESLIRRADTALYLGKESGRDRVVLDDESFSQLTPTPFVTPPLTTQPARSGVSVQTLGVVVSKGHGSGCYDAARTAPLRNSADAAATRA
jgi:diguanylate cyclase